jgi:hypothetical protein
MLRPKHLVSTPELVKYLHGIQPSTTETVSVYADSDTGLNLRHVTGSAWIEGEAVAHVGTFHFYSESAPYSRAAIERLVKLARA